MAEDLARRWGNLSLNEDEVLDVHIQPRAVEGLVSRGKFCLVGKLLAERFVGKDTIKRQMMKGWRPTGHLTFKVLGENLFLLEFGNEWDKNRVLKGRPWLFERDLFSVEDFDGLSSISEIVFDRAEFWVRMLNLPLACMGKEVGYQIGSTVGVVQEVDTDEEGVGWGKYLRVKIQIDLTKPLARGRTINLFGKKVGVIFQYEKLPRYCFDCGKIIHGREGCKYKGEDRKLESEKQYGTWLRVPSPRRRGEHNRMQWQGTKKEWDDSANKEGGEPNNKSMGSRNDSESDGGDPSLSEESPVQTEPVNGESSTAAGKLPVTEDGSSNGRGAVNGGNRGEFIAQAPVFNQKISQDVNGNNISAIKEKKRSGVHEELAEHVTIFSQGKSHDDNGTNLSAFNENRRLGENLVQAVNGLNLKGGGGEESNKDDPNGTAGDYIPKKREHSVKKSMPFFGAQNRGNFDEVTSEEKNKQVHVVQTWKRRARAGQQWPNASTIPISTGKRKTGGVHGAMDARQNGARRPKYNAKNGMALRDEAEDTINGSGMAGSVSQPRRPV
jgi:hypothetical protein